MGSWTELFNRNFLKKNIEEQKLNKNIEEEKKKDISDVSDVVKESDSSSSSIDEDFLVKVEEFLKKYKEGRVSLLLFLFPFLFIFVVYYFFVFCFVSYCFFLYFYVV